MGAPGYDDAPVVSIQRGPTARTITRILPFYRNRDFFGQQLMWMSDLPSSLRNHIKLIVVDDGSPAGEDAESELRLYRGHPLNLSLFKIEIDVRWNWLAARNIGAFHANDGWICASDMDHRFPVSTWETLIRGVLEPSVVYTFSRREHTGQEIHSHPNSWAMLKATYWKIGGYDEALSGLYGTDGDFRRRVAAAAKVKRLVDQLERHEYVADSSTTHYKRKQPEDAGKKAIIAQRRQVKDWRPRTMSFPFHEVEI